MWAVRHLDRVPAIIYIVGNYCVLSSRGGYYTLESTMV